MYSNRFGGGLPRRELRPFMLLSPYLTSDFSRGRKIITPRELVDEVSHISARDLS